LTQVCDEKEVNIFPTCASFIHVHPYPHTNAHTPSIRCRQRERRRVLMSALLSQHNHLPPLVTIMVMHTLTYKFCPVGRPYTVSVALPGSIIGNAQSPELRTYLAGQIARALVIFNVDEVVVFDEQTRCAQRARL